MVTVLNQGDDWEAVRERVKMFSRPVNLPSGCPCFQSAILGMPVVRYMGVEGGGMVATAGGTALRIKFHDAHPATEMDDLAAAHGLYACQLSEKLARALPVTGN
jgi:hypothetical protein